MEEISHNDTGEEKLEAMINYKEETQRLGDVHGLIRKVGEERLNRYKSQHPNATNFSLIVDNRSISTESKYSKIGRTTQTEGIVEASRYIASPEKYEEKVDKDIGESSFVTVLANNYKARSRIINGREWLFTILESNEDTKDMVDLTKYLLYKATDNNYGVTEFNYSTYKMNQMNGISGLQVLRTTTISREDFIAAVQSYAPAVRRGADTAPFRENAGLIYDIAVQNNINPVLVASQAYSEQGWKYPSKATYNYWGIAVYNGQDHGTNFTSIADGVQGYCNLINKIMNGQSQIYLDTSAKYATVNSHFTGSISTIYDVFSAYAYIGSGHTLEEEAQYVVDYVDNKMMKCGTNIFGAGIWNVYGTGSLSGVVQFAKQFEGLTTYQIGIPSYKSKCGAENIWGKSQWCAMFVSYCFDNCGLIPNPLTYSYNACQTGINKMRSLFVTRGSYIPLSGDIIFFDYHHVGVSHHTGIVMYSDGTKVYTIEGNCGGSYWGDSVVKCKDYSLTDSDIVGYLRMNF